MPRGCRAGAECFSSHILNMLPSILRTSAFDGFVSVPVVGPLELVFCLLLLAVPGCPFTWFCFFVSWILLWVDFEVSSVPLLFALNRVAQLTVAGGFCVLVVVGCATWLAGIFVPLDVSPCVVGFCSVFTLTLMETSCEIRWLDEDGSPLTKAVVLLLCVESRDRSLLGLKYKVEIMILIVTFDLWTTVVRLQQSKIPMY